MNYWVAFSFCYLDMNGHLIGVGLSFWGISFLAGAGFLAIGSLLPKVCEILHRSWFVVLSGWDIGFLALLGSGVTKVDGWLGWITWVYYSVATVEALVCA